MTRDRKGNFSRIFRDLVLDVFEHPKTEPTPPEISGYEILEVIGEGGMGAVYRARHLKLESDVAIKVLSEVDVHRPTEPRI